MHLQTLILCTFITISSPMDYGLKWGQKCKIPGPNEYLKHTEECEMSKGLHCQMYQQGPLCGCLIRSSLSYDEQAGECRRKPGHHCPFINTTDSSSPVTLPYNHRCHTNAECVLIDPIPEVEAIVAKTSKSKKKDQEQFAVCRCRPGYKESRDGLVCHSINSSPRVTFNSLVLLVGLLTLLT